MKNVSFAGKYSGSGIDSYSKAAIRHSSEVITVFRRIRYRYLQVKKVYYNILEIAEMIHEAFFCVKQREGLMVS